MDERLRRGIMYVLSRICVLALVFLLVLGAFYSSMKTSNIYFLLQDALKARLDIILLETEVESKQGFFTYDYLTGKEYESMRSKYSLYNINGYGHKLEFSNLFVWPWQKSKTVTVKEAVYAINGEFDTSQMTKAEAMAMDVYNIPAWKPSVYKVKLVYENGSWIVDQIIRKGDFDYQPPQTPSLDKSEIQALRTPKPSPTPEIDPGNAAGRSATISTPIRGDKVNLREGPATEYDVLRALENGTPLTVIEESDGWYLVRCADGLEGYVSGYHICFHCF